jgi:outer membrane receptor protein involved in Fe transport
MRSPIAGSGIALLLAVSSGISMAADQTPAATAPAAATTPSVVVEKKPVVKEATTSAAPEQIIITGSRIRHDEFTSDSPIQVIKKDQSVLAGLTTTTEVLQGSTVSGGSNQINNYFGGYVTDGGPGANTLSLRGLGAVRTLVLLNGRRLAPAGTRGSVGSADLNVLPSAMVDRIEILKDGASSIYGSDAVAGVVNIITRKGVKDFTAELTQESTEDGGGTQTTMSLTGGHSWDRLDISGSLEMYNRTNLAVGQRDWARCPTSAFIDPITGTWSDGSILDPTTGNPKCFPVGGDFGTASLANNYIAAIVDPFNAQTRWTPDPTAVNSPIPGWRNVNDLASRDGFTPSLLSESLISPTRNWTGFLNGSYDLHALGNGELYFELLYDHRDSTQIGARQLSLDYQLDANFNPHPFVPIDIYNAIGYCVTGNPFGDCVEARAFVSWGNDYTREQVGFSRFVGGLRGDLPFGNWRYDVNATLSRSQASYTFQSFLTDRIYNSTYVVPVTGPTTAPTRTVDGVTYTCASNIGSSNPICVPAPILDASFLSGNVDQAYRDYVWQNITGHTTYDENTIDANIDGSLFKVPAGDVRAALGLEVRSLKLDDEPAPDMIAGNLYNLTSAGITKGKDAVRELFGEIEVPLLRGLPMAESLTLNLSGRYTDYNSYGSDRTYKMGIGYTPVKWLKFRATKGSSFRAPALFEQYLSPTSGFYPGTVDPCSEYGTKDPASIVYINCASEGLPLNYVNNNGVTVFSAGGAASGIHSEKSHADTVGMVLQPSLPARAGDLAFAIDWWRINVGNQVAQIGAINLLNLCYNDPQFRAGGSYCAFSSRDSNGDITVNDNYLNIATQVAEGVDYNVRFSHSIGVGEFIADLRATRYLRQDQRVLPTDPLDKFNGTLQFPKWVGDADIRYKWKDYTVRYGLTYVDSMDSNDYLDVGPAVDPFYNFRVASYITHDVSLRYESPNKWEIIAGVRNLTNEAPKQITAGAYNRAGNSLLYSGYDYFGRRGFVTLSVTF